MKTLYEKFYDALTWSSIESIGYQLILLSHQILLFHVAGSSTYGLIGAVFSFIYLSIALFNFGFDDSIAPFFSLSTSSKNHFKRLVFPQLLPEIVIFLIYSIVIFLIGPSLITVLKTDAIDQSLLLIISGIIVCEGLKKTLRTFLQIAFTNKKTALVELATITFYMVFIWTAYWLGAPLTLTLLLLPLLITSIIGSSILGYAVYNIYKKLPESSEVPISSTITRRIVKNRFFSYLTHLNHQFFSGNFLVPIFAIQFGLSHAGILKLTSHAVHTISSIIHRVFGSSSFALLAHHKNMDIVEKRKAFYFATGYIHQALYAIFIFFFINYKKLLYTHGSAEMATYWPLILLFIIIHFSEHFFMMYEKFYITEEKIEYVFLLNALTTFFVYTMLYNTIPLSPSMILLGIAIIRIISFIILQTISFRLWKISPNFMIRPLYLFASCAFSAAVFILI